MKPLPYPEPPTPPWYKGWNIVTWVGESNGLRPNWHRLQIILPNGRSKDYQEINVFVEAGSQIFKAVNLLESALFELENPSTKETK